MLAIITSRGLRIAPSRSEPSGNKPAPCRHSRCSDPALTVPAVHLGGLTGKGFISDTHKGTTYPALSGTVLIYVCYPGIVGLLSQKGPGTDNKLYGYSRLIECPVLQAH